MFGWDTLDIIVNNVKNENPSHYVIQVIDVTPPSGYNDRITIICEALNAGVRFNDFMTHLKLNGAFKAPPDIYYAGSHCKHNIFKEQRQYIETELAIRHLFHGHKKADFEEIYEREIVLRESKLQPYGIDNWLREIQSDAWDQPTAIIKILRSRPHIDDWLKVRKQESKKGDCFRWTGFPHAATSMANSGKPRHVIDTYDSRASVIERDGEKAAPDIYVGGDKGGGSDEKKEKKSVSEKDARELIGSVSGIGADVLRTQDRKVFTHESGRDLFGYDGKNLLKPNDPTYLEWIRKHGARLLYPPTDIIIENRNLKHEDFWTSGAPAGNSFDTKGKGANTVLAKILFDCYEFKWDKPIPGCHARYGTVRTKWFHTVPIVYTRDEGIQYVWFDDNSKECKKNTKSPIVISTDAEDVAHARPEFTHDDYECITTVQYAAVPYGCRSRCRRGGILVFSYITDNPTLVGDGLCN